ncbi:MAG: CDP-alcohol phosphatidyltransferase family protein [Candidatus Anammoxibacter sp.]
MNIPFVHFPGTRNRSFGFDLRLITDNMSLPNILSLSRIFCVPLIAFCVIRFNEYNNYRYVALFTMFCAGVSDLLDGYFARKRNETTRLGIYLDAIADKLLIISVFILLSLNNLWPEPRFPVWLLIIVIAKEVVITIGALGITCSTGKTLKPTIFGKISTAMQVCAIVIVLLGNIIPVEIVITSFWLVAVFTCVCIAHYIYFGLNNALAIKR